MKKYNTIYELIKDVPGVNAGRQLRCDTFDGDIKYYFVKTWEEESSIWEGKKEYAYEKYNDTLYSLEEISDKKFFKPIGEWIDLIPVFPKQKDIYEFLYLIGDTRLVDSVDFIRAINPILKSKEYEKAVYGLLKKFYEDKYFK